MSGKGLYEKLIEYRQFGRYPFHMPGHKRKDKLLSDAYEIDITEINGFDNLHHPEGIIKESMDNASGFFGTDLDLVLRENGVENVIIVGTKTNCCIRATVTDAFYLNYNPYVIRECVATNSETVNEVHLTDIDKYLGKVIDMNTFSKMLEEGQL